MLVTLDTPYVDTTAADLCFALGLPEQPALHVLDVPLPSNTGAPAGSLLRLRLLGASHQAVLRTGGGAVVETVACLPGLPRDLPAAVDDTDGYRFTARIRRLSPAEVAVEVGGLRHRLTGDPTALVGVFPGSPDALTALQAHFGDRRIRWSTWHAYPQTGELVETETVVTLR